MKTDFDMSFGFMEKCRLRTVMAKLSRYSMPVYNGSVEDALTQFTPESYSMDWWGKNISSRSNHYQLNTWLDFTPVLLNAAAGISDDGPLDEQRRFVVRWIADWCRKFPYDPSDPSGARSGNDFAWYDMAAGIRAAILGYLLGLNSAEVMDDNVRVTLERSAKDHLSYLRDPSLWAAHSNHGMYQSMGLLALVACAPDLSDSPDEDRCLAVGRIRDYFSRALSDDGVHLEHSPIYHSLVLRALKSISGLLDPDRADEQALIDTFANIQDAQSAMFLPNGVLLPFGDSRLMEASRLRPENNQLLSEYNEKLQYLVSDGEVGEPTLDSLYYSAEAGFASYKSENSSNANSFLAASGWFHSLVHKQLDDLSLVWAENSMLILTDPGRYGYEGKTSNASDLRAKGFYYSDPNRIYVESAHAHNTVEIDNQTDNRREAVAYQSAFTVAAKADNAIILDMDIIREPLVRHQRLCVYIPGQLLAVIDELDSIDDTPHDFTQWWQFFPAWEVVEDLKNSRLSLAYDAEWKHKLENENGTPDADEPEMEAENRKAAHELFSDPEATVHAAFGCHTPEGQKLANRPVHHHGTKDADGKLKGWTSLSPVSLRPAPAVSVALAAPAPKAVMSAVFEFNDKSSQASPPDSVNFKTERRMMNSLSWKSGSSVDDIRYRRRDNKLEIYIGGGRKIELDRTVHPRNEEAQAIMRARAAIASGSEPDEVFRYFDVAARRSWPPAIKEAAKYAHQIGDKDRQLTLSAKAYEVGGSSEILPLALSLITDDPETADLDRAEKLLKEAAENNIRAAHYHLGELYENPDFDRANEEDAKTAYRRGAQLNHSGSILRLAEILEKQGKYPDAVIWYEKVADNDNQKAQLKLADLYSNKAELPELYNPKAALRYYEVAAEKGNKIAGFNGSKLALNKKLDVYDRELGKRLLEIASDAGSGVAAFDLAKLLLEEKQVDRDRAKMLLLMAKNAGINNAKPLLEKLVEEE